MPTTPTIFEVKEQAVTDTPLLLFDCTLANGPLEHWCPHGVTAGGRRNSAELPGARQCGLALFGDRAADGLEGRGADGELSVLRPAQQRPGNGYGGHLSRDLQPARRDPPGHVPNYRHQPDESAEAADASGAYSAAVSVELSGHGG